MWKASVHRNFTQSLLVFIGSNVDKINCLTVFGDHDNHLPGPSDSVVYSMNYLIVSGNRDHCHPGPCNSVVYNRNNLIVYGNCDHRPPGPSSSVVCNGNYLTDSGNHDPHLPSPCNAVVYPWFYHTGSYCSTPYLSHISLIDPHIFPHMRCHAIFCYHFGLVVQSIPSFRNPCLCSSFEYFRYIWVSLCPKFFTFCFVSYTTQGISYRSNKVPLRCFACLLVPLPDRWIPSSFRTLLALIPYRTDSHYRTPLHVPVQPTSL